MAIKTIFHNGDNIEDSGFCSASTKENPIDLFPKNLVNGWREIAANNLEALTQACQTMNQNLEKD